MVCERAGDQSIAGDKAVLGLGRVRERRMSRICIWNIPGVSSQSFLRRTDEKSVWMWRLSVSSVGNLSWKEFKTIAFLLEDIS